jgi:hypothetical protein
MNNRIDTAANLSKAIKDGLLKKFGKTPSASLFANQFNLRAYGTKTITRETARKWILGLAVPEIDKLVVLINWLDIDASELFKYQAKASNNTSKESSSLNDNDLSNIDYHLFECLNGLTKNSKSTLYLAALMLKQLENNNHNIELCHQLINTELKKSEKYNINQFNHNMK